MTYQIQANVPLPARIGGRSGKSKYPFAAMQVGQMFWADSDTKPTTLRSAIGIFQKKNPGYHFAVRTVEGKVGVWRVSKEAADAAPADTTPEEENEEEYA
jgi:hypothetical protein